MVERPLTQMTSERLLEHNESSQSVRARTVLGARVPSMPGGLANNAICIDEITVRVRQQMVAEWRRRSLTKLYIIKLERYLTKGFCGERANQWLHSKPKVLSVWACGDRPSRRDLRTKMERTIEWAKNQASGAPFPDFWRCFWSIRVKLFIKGKSCGGMPVARQHICSISDHGLNRRGQVAIREALGDPLKPRYVETLRARGVRFVAPFHVRRRAQGGGAARTNCASGRLRSVNWSLVPAGRALVIVGSRFGWHSGHRESVAPSG